jgi:NAD(P)H-hydrate epimerase
VIDALLMGLYGAEAMRAMDTSAIDGIGIPGGHLMERAGVAVADQIRERYDPDAVVVYAGKGNNGGDGFVVARELFNDGRQVTVYAVDGRDVYKGDALLNLRIAETLGIDIRDGVGDDRELSIDDSADEDERLDPGGLGIDEADVVVDAIFGTGFSGAAAGNAARAIDLINEAPGIVVSIDIASGVSASTGAISGPAVYADLTVTMQAAKVGHFITPGGAFSGEVAVVPIGIPPVCESDPDVWLLTAEGVQPLLQLKGVLDHKRSVGTVLVIGGARGMTGAAFLAAMAALRSGAGLVHVAQPAGSIGVSPFVEVITVPVPGDDHLGNESLASLRAQLHELKAVVLGPGLGRVDDTVVLVRELIREPVPMLIDADGLYALGDRLELLAERSAPTIITPHEGELARLMGCSASEVAGQRLEFARQAAVRSHATVLLKGAGSIVADPAGATYVIPTGNPGLATPGSGDVLSGVIVSQLAKGLTATDAACLGGFLHGSASDLAAAVVGTEGMVAGDLLDFLPAAVEKLKSGGEEEAADEGHEHAHH